MKKWAIIAISLLGAVYAFGQVPSSKPPMGWNSYFIPYTGSCAPTETFVKAQADAMRTSLGASGYKLVSVDCGWASATRTGGLQTADPTNFPSGIPSLVSYLHGHGQYIGLYSTPGPVSVTNCGKGPGSYGFETSDANQFANWSIDYLKYDFCTGSTVYPNTTPGVQSAYQLMGTALAGTSEPNMYYLVSVPDLTYGYGAGWSWFPVVGGNEYWTVEIAQAASLDTAEFGTPWATYAPHQSKGHWLNDDYLICGHYTIQTVGGAVSVTDNDCKTQFTLFAMLAAPLIISVDVTTLNSTALDILNNSEVIAVNQDSLGIMGSQITNVACGGSTCPVWTRTLADGTIAAALFNRDSASHSVTLNYSSLATGTTHYETRDLWAKQNLGVMTSYSATLSAGSTSMVLLTATSGGLSMPGIAVGAVVR
jgi:alpha-galactosidase